MISKSWGAYKTTSKTKLLYINPYQSISLQYHKDRDEHWRVLQGNGWMTLGLGNNFPIEPGFQVTIERGVLHKVKASSSQLVIQEVSIGDVDENDIVRYDEEVVVASGYFDPLHEGHVEYFKLAKRLCNRLVVILNNDFQAKLKKGKPFMGLGERKIILETISYVDEVFPAIDQDETVIDSIRALSQVYGYNISYFAKGGDRELKDIPEKGICKELGIEIKEGLGEKIQSSSNLIGGKHAL